MKPSPASALSSNPITPPTERPNGVINTDHSTTDTTTVSPTTPESNITSAARKLIALSGNPIQEVSSTDNLIVTLIDVNIGDALYVRTKKIISEGKSVLSIRINKKLLEALEDSAHPQHKIAKEMIDKQLSFAKQEAIKPITSDFRAMSVNEYTARVGLERLKIGFYDDTVGSKKDFFIETLESFIKEEKFDQAERFVKQRFMFDQELVQVLNDFKTSLGNSTVQRYSEAVFSLPTKKIPVKIKCHSPSSIVGAYERAITKFKSLESDLANLSLNRTRSITAVEEAPFAGRADDNERMIVDVGSDPSLLWIPRVLKHEEQHFKTRVKLGDGTSSSKLHQKNGSDNSNDASKPITLEHEFMSNHEGPPQLLLSELLSYRAECGPMLNKLNDPTFFESKDFSDLLKYRRSAKIALKQLEEIKLTHLNDTERKQLEMIKKSWENLDKKLEPYMPEILKQLSNHSDRYCRREEYHLLIEEHKKANAEDKYPALLGQLIDYETNYKFLEDIVTAQEGEFPKEFQDRAMKRYMSTKFQADQKGWKVTLHNLLVSSGPELRYRGYRYAIESFKAANSDEQKAEFLKIFSEHISKEEHWKPLERLIFSSEDEVPKEFQDPTAKRYMSSDFQADHFHWKATLKILLERNHGGERKKGYDLLIESYKMASDKDEYFDLFKHYANNEIYLYSLHGLARGQNIPPEFKQIAIERFTDPAIKSRLTERLPAMLSEKYNWFSYKYCADLYEWSTQPEEKNIYHSMFENAINSETDIDTLRLITRDEEIAEKFRALASNRLLNLAKPDEVLVENAGKMT